jgi:2-haloacid dehalogenase
MDDYKVLAFDVFGTVVDWYSSVRREVETVLPNVDAEAFTLDWRDGYGPAMQRVASGELGWTLIDDLHRMILDSLLDKYSVAGLSEDEKVNLNKVWHRLDPWPDSVEGLTRLKSRYSICTLSNGNLGLLADMAKHAGLPWDLILSAEVFRQYKPHPDTYIGVANVFDVPPSSVMLVAAHHNDLAVARDCGLATAYIERPLEFGPSKPKDVSSRSENTYHANSITNLATQLGC